MDTENVMGIVALSLIFGTGVIIAWSISWYEHRTRTRAIDVLRIYAERGEEPPPSVVQALTAVSGWGRQAWATQAGATGTPPPRTRAWHLAHAAANAVTVAGMAGVVWWRLFTSDEPGGLVVVAFLVGLFFAASLAARLVGAYYAPDR